MHGVCRELCPAEAGLPPALTWRVEVWYATGHQSYRESMQLLPLGKRSFVCLNLGGREVQKSGRRAVFKSEGKSLYLLRRALSASRPMPNMAAAGSLSTVFACPSGWPWGSSGSGSQGYLHSIPYGLAVVRIVRR